MLLLYLFSDYCKDKVPPPNADNSKLRIQGSNDTICSIPVFVISVKNKQTNKLQANIKYLDWNYNTFFIICNIKLGGALCEFLPWPQDTVE